MSGVSSGVGGGPDPFLENLAILANPAKLQERLDSLAKSTQEANDAWERVRLGETAEAIAEREAAIKVREEEVEQKVQALAGMASILKVRQ
jgi:hypothetical protein